MDEEYARHILGKISYFRLKSYWWDMKDPQTGLFLPCANFHTVTDRYYFDRSLRQILFSAIETIEIALRTKMVNHFSLERNGLWYLDQSLFRNRVLHEKHIKTLKREFARSKDPAVQHYIASIGPNWHVDRLDGDNPDAWFIFEYATFGTLSKIFENIKPDHPRRSAIANEFGLYFSTDFSSWLQSIAVIRNFAAHHSRLWNRNFTTPPSTPSNMPYPWLATPLSNRLKHTPYCVITNILYLSNALRSGNTLKRRIIHLINNNPQIDISRYGFTGNWHNEPIWRQSNCDKGTGSCDKACDKGTSSCHVPCPLHQCHQ